MKESAICEASQGQYVKMAAECLDSHRICPSWKIQPGLFVALVQSRYFFWGLGQFSQYAIVLNAIAGQKPFNIRQGDIFTIAYFMKLRASSGLRRIASRVFEICCKSPNFYSL